jgi:hypothetical protein
MGGIVFRKNIGDRLARFRQIDTKNIKFITTLWNFRTAPSSWSLSSFGKRATVFQLPASPIEERPREFQPAAQHEAVNG